MWGEPKMVKGGKKKNAEKAGGGGGIRGGGREEGIKARQPPSRTRRPGMCGARPQGSPGDNKSYVSPPGPLRIRVPERPLDRPAQTLARLLHRIRARPRR